MSLVSSDAAVGGTELCVGCCGCGGEVGMSPWTAVIDWSSASSIVEKLH